MANLLDKELNDYLLQLNDTEKKSILLMLKTFIQGRSEPTRNISIEQYNIEIDKALAEVAMGNSISQDEMERLAAKW